MTPKRNESLTFSELLDVDLKSTRYFLLLHTRFHEIG